MAINVTLRGGAIAALVFSILTVAPRQGDARVIPTDSNTVDRGPFAPLAWTQTSPGQFAYSFFVADGQGLAMTPPSA